jgi:peptidyl-prolyl cis-trans isomerase B (cyclophilin B)
MARSADPNSASSQFFIVHKNSNFLNGEYTAFGRIVTNESFETLDRIAEVETEQNNRPLKTDQVTITNTSIVNRSEISNLLELPEPGRISSESINIENPKQIESQTYESTVYDVKFNVPEGWLLQQPEKINENSPDIIATGPKIGKINPVISLTIKDTNGKKFDELIREKNNNLQPSIKEGTLILVSQEKSKINKNEAYTTIAIGFFESKNETFDVKFHDVIIYTDEKSYTLTYSNDFLFFLDQLDAFETALETFEITTEESQGGGCLIATATYGSEMALEVQQLRELRDNTLLNTQSGTKFMGMFNEIYYSFSPIIADYERENPVFKEMVKLAITPMISSLSILNYVDMNSESEVLGYGISLILLNLGMYLGVPAVVIVGIKRKF